MTTTNLPLDLESFVKQMKFVDDHGHTLHRCIELGIEISSVESEPGGRTFQLGAPLKRPITMRLLTSGPYLIELEESGQYQFRTQAGPALAYIERVLLNQAAQCAETLG